MSKTFATLVISVVAAVAAVASPLMGAVSWSGLPVRAVALQQGTAATKVTGVKREPHPEIRKAIAALERAKYDLQHASHDFGGHRADALAATDKAIEQLKLALRYDRR